MSDFYQILQRERKRDQEPFEEKENIVVEKNAVEKKPKPRAKKILKTPILKTSDFIIKKPKKKRSLKNKIEAVDNSFAPAENILEKEVANPIWLSLSEAAKLGGVQKKTIKRAIRSNFLRYKIIENRYLVDLRSILHYFFNKKKLLNKMLESGIGQYVERWKK